ncbi:MAG: type II toxin-antitoxin system PemK/MazF family toxin [Oscillospiraceae bacterium]|jgi:hypothetical protein|nr:type II toxin-antitoxin system PemK/MazF family toxin [Oscillospiraceae bacterium]
MNPGDIYYAYWEYEDCPGSGKNRPVLIIENSDTIKVICLKMTSNKKIRTEYDYTLKYWQESGLRCPTVVRTDKRQDITISDFRHKIGTIHKFDWVNILRLIAPFS